jgi:hypothetical protein
MNLSFVLLDPEDGMAMAIMPDASLRKLQALVDADVIEIVNIKIQDHEYYLVVDENGIANRKPINYMASVVAGHCILGTALAILPNDFKEMPFDMESENGTMQ